MKVPILESKMGTSPGEFGRRLFYLSFKKLGLAVAVFIVAVLMHNLLSLLLRLEEPFFFILAVIVVPLYLVISVVYTLVLRWNS